jgi:hypothetical protein
VTLKKTIGGFILTSFVTLAAPQNPPVAFHGSIEGFVKEAETDRPIPGASVYLLDAARLGSPGPNDRPVVADERGHFTISVSNPGAYRLLPDQVDFVYSRPARLSQPRRGVVVRVSENAKVLKLDLPMLREGSITGRVLDIATGQPIPSLAVSAGFPGYEISGSVFVRPLGTRRDAGVGMTNDRGEFRLFGLQPGDYIVVVSGSGLGVLPRYYPGVYDAGKATLIHVNAGQETRAAPMLTESPLRSVQVILRFTQRFEDLTIVMLGTNTFSGQLLSPFLQPPASRDVTRTLSPGPYDLSIEARSGENELLYAREKFEVGTQNMIRQITLTPGIRVTGSITLQDAEGRNLDATAISCRLGSPAGVASAQSPPHGCLRSQVAPGHFWLEMRDMPPDAYVASAKSGERDMLRDGLTVERETQFQIALATPGAVLEGMVRDDKGERLSDATVALVPDAPYRNAVSLYRSDVSAYDGTFELRGVAPGSYQLFAWPDLLSPSYRNADFMKTYEGKGKPIVIGGTTHITVDLTSVE